MRLPILVPKGGLPKAGLVAEYKMAKNNLLNYSEPLLSQVEAKSATVTQANFTEKGLTNGIGFPALAQLDFAYIKNYTCDDTVGYTISLFVVMDDGSAPRLGNGINTDMQLLIGGNTLSGGVVTLIEGNLYRISSFNPPNARSAKVNNGVIRYAAQSGKSFRITGYQLSRGTILQPYEKTTDNQSFIDTSGKGKNGTLGSTTGADTNDPIFNGQGLVFATDDYVKLPYMIDAEQDFTVYLVVNIGESIPANIECYWAGGKSDAPTQNVAITRRNITGELWFSMVNDAGGTGSAKITNPIPGIRVLVAKRKNNVLFLKDIQGNILVANAGAPASPATYNQMSLGTLLRSTTACFVNQPEYYASFFSRATTDAEDIQMLRYVKRELAKSGVMLS